MNIFQYLRSKFRKEVSDEVVEEVSKFDIRATGTDIDRSPVMSGVMSCNIMKKGRIYFPKNTTTELLKIANKEGEVDVFVSKDNKKLLITPTKGRAKRKVYITSQDSSLLSCTKSVDALGLKNTARCRSVTPVTMNKSRCLLIDTEASPAQSALVGSPDSVKMSDFVIIPESASRFHDDGHAAMTKYGDEMTLPGTVLKHLGTNKVTLMTNVSHVVLLPAEDARDKDAKVLTITPKKTRCTLSTAGLRKALDFGPVEYMRLDMSLDTVEGLDTPHVVVNILPAIGKGV